MHQQRFPPDAKCVYCGFTVTNNDGTRLWGIPIHISCVQQIDNDVDKMHELFERDIDDPFGEDSI